MAVKEPTPEQQRIAQLEALLQQVTQESEAKDGIIAGQEEQLAAANLQGAGSLSVVSHEGRQYQVLAGKFSLDDNVIHHHELKGMPSLVAKLVEEKSPLLQLLDDTKEGK